LLTGNRSETHRTIEGDLFPAFVAAGAISKANAADPKKSSLVRCARTDRGVHAAGNVVSLKLIIEDPDVVQKINEKLNPQVRVWGIEVANKSFSCYQMCDSRIYEYLIPSHCFLPPHPSTYLGRRTVELAEQAGDASGLQERQAEVASFWDEVDNRDIKPILEGLPGEVRRLVQRALYIGEDEAPLTGEVEHLKDTVEASVEEKECIAEESMQNPEQDLTAPHVARRSLINETVKLIKDAYLQAKRAYRIHPTRIAHLQEALNKYLGTNNFYNYTIQRAYKDPSAKRLIKSFTVNPEPIIVNGREWLSLKVHGQSFMMHQIRKMVAMAALVVRCGCDPNRITNSYSPTKIAIPRAPGLGLLLERPIFDSYNKRATEFGREPIDFSKFEKEIEEFKRQEIYDRIFREEEETNS
jgi:tRNA pseudouridine38-40 synthase